MPPDDPLQARLQFGLQASQAAADFVVPLFQNPDLLIETKADFTPVTRADRGAEQLLRERILAQFPHDAVLGEEFGESPGTSGYCWVLDPVDGTKSFVHGVPLFGMLIGILHEEQPVAGICRIPALRECVYAARGGGAWWQRADGSTVPARVTKTNSLGRALFCFTDLECWRATDRLQTLERVASSVKLARGWGDCYGHILVATGRADLMIDPLLAVWDAAPLLPILEEAGGCFVDFDGNAVINGGNGLSVTAGLKQQVLDLLRGVPE